MGLIYAGFAVFLLVIDFIWATIFQRNEKSLEDKLSAQEKIENKVSEKDIFNLTIKKYDLAKPLLLTALVVIAAFSCGNAEALNQEKFVLLEANSNKAVIRFYNDNLIAVEFNKETKKLTNNFLIIKKDFNDTNIFTTIKLGRLLPSK